MKFMDNNFGFFGMDWNGNGKDDLFDDYVDFKIIENMNKQDEDRKPNRVNRTPTPLCALIELIALIIFILICIFL